MQWIFKIVCLALLGVVVNSSFAEITTYRRNDWSEDELRVKTLMERMARVVDALIWHTNDPYEKQLLFMDLSKAVTDIITIHNKVVTMKNRGLFNAQFRRYPE